MKQTAGYRESVPEERSMAMRRPSVSRNVERKLSPLSIPTEASRLELMSCDEWNLNTIPYVPADQFLRHKCLLESVLSIETILRRICRFVRIRSIASTFDEKEASVDCQTENLLHFVIYFWRSPRDSILVELQRRRGCSIELHCLRRDLFTTLETGEVPHTDPLSCHGMPKAVCERICKKYPLEPKSPDCCKEGIARCRALLESRYEDRARLGMESLLSLTDTDVVLQTTAESVARALIHDTGPQTPYLRADFLRYIRHSQENINNRSVVGDYSFEDMHILALRVLANSLQVLRHVKVNKRIDLGSEFWRTIADSLKQDLHEAAEKPREAALAANNLCLIEEIFPGSSAVIDVDHLLPVLMQANAFGKAHNLSLEQASQNLMNHLQ